MPVCRRLQGLIIEVVTELCPYDHKDFDTSYKDVDNKVYCSEGYYLFGIKCGICSATFVSCNAGMEKDQQGVIPSAKYPIKLCIGQVQYSCTHCVCYECFNKKLLECSDNKRRKRN